MSFPQNVFREKVSFPQNVFREKTSFPQNVFLEKVSSPQNVFREKVTYRSKNNPVSGDRLCIKDLLLLLQGVYSDSPRYAPAYALTAPNGNVFTGQLIIKNLILAKGLRSGRKPDNCL